MRSRVLVIEDDQQVREILREFLADEGFDVVAVGSGREALRLLTTLAAEGPDALLLDVHLHDLTAASFVRTYRALPEPHAPIILLSGALHLDRLAQDLGAAGWVAKPFDLEDVLDVLRSALGSSRRT